MSILLVLNAATIIARQRLKRLRRNMASSIPLIQMAKKNPKRIVLSLSKMKNKTIVIRADNKKVTKTTTTMNHRFLQSH